MYHYIIPHVKILLSQTNFFCSGRRSRCLKRCGPIWSQPIHLCLWRPLMKEWLELGSLKESMPICWSPPWMNILNNANPVIPWRWAGIWTLRVMVLRHQKDRHSGKVQHYFILCAHCVDYRSSNNTTSKMRKQKVNLEDISSISPWLVVVVLIQLH